MDLVLDPKGPAASLAPPARLPPARLPPARLPKHASLFLDFDGTLVDLAERPDAVRASNRVRAIVTTLNQRLQGRLAIVTGRDAAFVRAQLGLDADGAEAVSIAGSHGQEFHFADGTTSIPEPPEGLASIADALASHAAAHDGLLVERKPLGVALHYRLVPELEGWSRDLAELLAQAGGLHVQPGKMMVELRAPGGDKGSAVARFLETPPFAGTVPVMLGDDLTDEPGFAAAAAHDGWGVLVGPARPSAARYRLAGVAHALDWLEAVAWA